MNLNQQLFSRRLRPAVGGIAFALSLAASAAGTIDFDLPSQPLGDALRAAAERAGVQIVFPADSVKGLTSPVLKGRFAPEAALRALIAGTGLKLTTLGDGRYGISSGTEIEGTQRNLGEIEVRDTRLGNSYAAPAVTVAGKIPLAPREIPNSVSVITRQQMDDQNMSTVWDALNQATGVTAVSNDGSQAQFHARGYALEVMNDGMPAVSALSGYQQFDLAIYDRVEVLRGPAGLLQGSGAPSGTVNLVKKRPTENLTAYVVASAGSWKNYRTEADISGPLSPDKALRGRAVVSLQDRGFYYDRGHDNKWLGFGTLEYDFSPRTTLQVSLVNQYAKTPSFSGLPAYTTGQFLSVPRSTNVYPDWNRTWWKTEELATELQHRFDNQWLATIKLSRRDQRFYFKDSYPSTGVTPGTMTMTYARREADYRYHRDAADFFVSGPFNLFGRTHNLLVGYNFDRLQYDYDRGTASNVTNVVLGNPASVPEPSVVHTIGGESDTWQQGIYSQLRLKVADPATLVFGGRHSDYYSRTRGVAPSAQTGWTPGAVAKGQFTPYTGLVYDLTKSLTLYGSYADIFVPQTQVTAGGNTLDPRVGRQYEVGAKTELLDGKLNATAALFNIRDRNRAYADPDNPGYYLPLGLAESKGIETEVVGKLAPGWDVSAGYTYLTTKYLTIAASSLGNPLSFWYPRNTLKLWTNYRFVDGDLKGFSVGGGLNSASKSASGTSPTDREQGGYAVVNLQVGYQIDKTYSASFSVNNVFDRSYYTRVGGTNTYNTFGEPRNYLLTLRATM